jgi:hypothetical protein
MHMYFVKKVVEYIPFSIQKKNMYRHLGQLCSQYDVFRNLWQSLLPGYGYYMIRMIRWDLTKHGMSSQLNVLWQQYRHAYILQNILPTYENCNNISLFISTS